MVTDRELPRTLVMMLLEPVGSGDLPRQTGDAVLLDRVDARRRPHEHASRPRMPVPDARSTTTSPGLTTSRMARSYAETRGRSRR